MGRRVEQIDLPRGATIGAIVRRTARARVAVKTEVIMAHHDTVIQAEDHVIVFVDNERGIPSIEKLFQVNVGFF